MDRATKSDARLLLIDTCGDRAGVALSAAERVLEAEDLPRGGASAEMLAAVRRLLAEVGWRLADLDAVGVVSGPGSFTGVRAGLAAAKGLCVSTGLAMAAVSRLEVLADASAAQEGFAALDAARGELYVRDLRSGRERLCASADLVVMAGKHLPIVVAEQRVLELLSDCNAVLRTLHVGDALDAVRRRLLAGGDDVSLTDGNYVREESDIYRRQAADANASPAKTS